MENRIRTVLTSLLAGIVTSAGWVSAQAPKGVKTVLDGVYTEAQAARGQQVYDMTCASCHEGAAFDGTVLEGGSFVNSWREDTLEPLYTYMSTGMPLDNPGSLKENVYRDILAYLLKKNSYRAGSNELTAEAIQTTLLVGEDGPKPLPPNAMVQVTGCFTAGPNGTWTLSKGSAPSRIREGDQITPEELKKAEAKPLGTGTLRLQNLDDLEGGFKPEAVQGHKVLTKGVLIQQANNDRINVTALKSVAASCGP